MFCVAEKPKPQPGARKSKTQAEIKQEKAEKLAKERAAAAEAAKIDPAEAVIEFFSLYLLIYSQLLLLLVETKTTEID